MDFMHYKAWLYVTFWDNLECNVQWRLWVSRHFKCTLDSSFIFQISRTYMHILKTFEFFESNRSDSKLDSKILESKRIESNRDFQFIIEFKSNRIQPQFEIFESNPHQIRFENLRFDSIRFDSIRWHHWTKCHCYHHASFFSLCKSLRFSSFSRSWTLRCHR